MTTYYETKICRDAGQVDAFLNERPTEADGKTPVGSLYERKLANISVATGFVWVTVLVNDMRPASSERPNFERPTPSRKQDDSDRIDSIDQ